MWDEVKCVTDAHTNLCSATAAAAAARLHARSGHAEDGGAIYSAAAAAAGQSEFGVGFGVSRFRASIDGAAIF